MAKTSESRRPLDHTNDVGVVIKHVKIVEWRNANDLKAEFSH